MTVVEFFDGVSINNMVSCLAIKPEKIIFVGQKKMMRKQEEAYRRFVNKYGIRVTFEFKPVNVNNLAKLIELLTEIVEKEDECTFDLTGGEDTVLVAMGIVYEKYHTTKKVQMHRFNINTGMASDFDNDGVIPSVQMPELTVEDNITLYGGSIVPYDGNKGTFVWDIDEDFEKDVRTMWTLCKKNPTLWNAEIIAMASIAKRINPEQPELYVKVNAQRFETVLITSRVDKKDFKRFLEFLHKQGLLQELKANSQGIEFLFKNSQVKRCLTKAGNVLELMVLFSAKNATDKQGNKRYNDAVVGAFIDWDSSLHDFDDEEKDTANEVDVVLMRGIVPVFVSCKNGNVDENELYKLNTVASRFGGPYAKKVLVVTSAANQSKNGYEYLCQRAEDMKIQILENVHIFTDDEFERKISNLLC